MKLDRIEVSAPLLHWEGILQRWICLNKEIYHATKGEFAPYSCRERPNIGVMACAAVKAGWAALEECWSEKNAKPNAKETYHGRVDLMLWRESRHERIEAKFTCDGFLELKRKIKTRHDSAKDEAARLGRSPNSRNLALTFIVPRVEHYDLKLFQDAALDLMGHCMKLSPAIFASVFPGKAPRRTGDEHDENMISAGIIVIGDIASSCITCRSRGPAKAGL